MADPNELEAAGLYDPDASEAPQRLALLEYLLDLGVTVDELRATPRGEEAALASLAALWPDRELLTMEEAAARGGLPRDFLEKIWRAAGFVVPRDDERTIVASEIDAFATLRFGVDLFGEDVTIQLARVLGAAAERVADAAISSFIVNVAPDALRRDPSGLELARMNAVASAMLPYLVQGFDVLLRHHVVMARRFDEFQTEGVDLQVRSIGFADLVGSTKLTNELEVRALAEALTQFDATASETVVSGGGRVVKLIGDEIMFASPDAGTAAGIGLALVDAFVDHAVLPPVRAAVATGRVVARDGDYSGSVVNLAARAAKVARASTVLVDSATRTAVGDALRCKRAGAFKLKGFTERVPLFRVTREPIGPARG